MNSFKYVNVMDVSTVLLYGYSENEQCTLCGKTIKYANEKNQYAKVAHDFKEAFQL